MSERNARLLRKYIEFAGMKETIDPLGSDSPALRRPNPIVEDFRTVFESGTARQKATLAAFMRTHMESVLTRRALRSRSAR